MTERKRCAIYTRKSTEEGLEQAFNSLDAQYEACSAYILSQAHEGWEQVRERYDDGGWSGGNMDRPALKQLLQDVEAGRVDIIVVYKVDRLTRSLADFARIVDTLDKAGASFVSVTQAFNTTNSMGRLTLNVLLSFAQFEREVTGERIRDKIAASKRKGMWMGGPVPLGYRVEDRRLVIESDEARTVQIIFERYAALGSIQTVADELNGQGLRTKVKRLRDGRVQGGVKFSRGPLSQLLKNPVYIGKVHHNGELYEGQHEAIISAVLWEDAQRIRNTNGSERKLGTKLLAPSLLTGLITDPDGRAMTPSHCVKGARRYRYYISRDDEEQSRASLCRVPARELETVALSGLKTLLLRRAECALIEGSVSEDEFEGAVDVATNLVALSIPEQRAVALEVGLSVRLSETAISLHLAAGEGELRLDLPARLVRRGHELRLVLAPDHHTPGRSPDPVLLKLLVQAAAAQRMIVSGEDRPTVARYGKRHLWQLLRISWLAPDITNAIIEGRQPVELTGRTLLRATNIPLDWSEQRAFFGFA
ncbi:recombinase family protein [Croceibacterium sp. LX-88]|uniref:Recombinase family protein n=1 Tax=Croceibacterium selenioxidans TaxID=2838833 RepID=A0ABS5W6B7_9SPHN|nr:recombinase family protein [Croceibacterium selenioxidans]MBT2134637.1 recombinase family protein [Croceibacterium selenioxidans]